MARESFRRRIVFEIKYRYFDSLELVMPLSHGFSCPLCAANSFYSTRWNDPVVPEEPFRVKVNSLSKPGSYILRISLVQEFIRWFDEPPTSVINPCIR